MSGNEERRFALNCPLPEGEEGTVELAHGGGGLKTWRLIDEVFRPAFGASPEDFTHDGAVFDINGTRLAFTTDSYVIRPLFFPGGDIGSLAVNGTVNDLAMCGAEPLYLSAGLVIEEGFALEDLHRVVASMRDAAQTVGVRFVTGDTKVVEHGKGDGLYVNTSGVGRCITPFPISPRAIQAGDAVVVSGDIGRHGVAVMAVREALGFETELKSDCAPLAEPVQALIAADVELHCLRDLTRGGLAAALVEISTAAKAAIRLEESAIPVSDAVRGACEILGLDPLYVANEGRFVAFVPEAAAEQAVSLLRNFNCGAAVIGRVGAAKDSAGVHLDTIGGSRVLDLPTGEQLPRIC